jgi:hypothetical protein
MFSDPEALMAKLASVVRTWWHAPLLVAAVFLGGWLRFDRLGLMEFKLDEALLHRAALMQASGDFQLHGIVSSVGLRNPPMSVYLLSIPALFSKSPLFMAGFIALLNTAAIVLTYILARHWLSRGAALFATWFFAVSPWAIMFSRKIWAQDLLPFFTTLFFICLIRWVRTSRWRWMIGATVSYAVLCQIHYSALALLPIIPGVLIWKRSKVAGKQFAVGCVLFLLLWVPFLIVILRGDAFAEGGYGRPRARLKRYPEQAAKAFLWEGRLAGYGGLREIVFGSGEAKTRRWADVAFGCFILACLWAVAWQSRSRRELLILMAWLLLPPLLLSLNRSYFHYMVICYPASFVAFGVLLELMHKGPGRGGTRHIFVVMAVAAISFAVIDETAFTLRLRDDLKRNGGAAGDYGVTYRSKLDVAHLLLKEAPSGRYALADRTNPTPSEKTYDYLYSLLGGEAERVPVGVPGTPVYILFGPETGGRMRSESLRDAGDVQLGPIRVQKLVPVRNSGRERGEDGQTAD